MSLRNAALPLLLLFPFSACDQASEPPPSDAGACPSGKCDSTEDETVDEQPIAEPLVTELRCNVVQGDADALLPHIYMFDELGEFAGGTRDHAEVVLVSEDFGDGPRPLSMAIGRTVLTAEIDELATTDEPADDTDHDQLRWTGRDVKTGDNYEVRVFTDNGVGILMHGAGGGNLRWRNNLDCSGNAAPLHDLPFDDHEPLLDDPNDLQCTIVAWDQGTGFDSAIGSAWSFEPDGTDFTEDGHEDVSISVTDDGIELDMGGIGFETADGDFIERVQDTEELEDAMPFPLSRHGVFVWRFAHEGSSSTDELRIFPGNGLGVLMENIEDELSTQPMAWLDCRPGYRGPEQLF